MTQFMTQNFGEDVKQGRLSQVNERQIPLTLFVLVISFYVSENHSFLLMIIILPSLSLFLSMDVVDVHPCLLRCCKNASSLHPHLLHAPQTEKEGKKKCIACNKKKENRGTFTGNCYFLKRHLPLPLLIFQSMREREKQGKKRDVHPFP